VNLAARIQEPAAAPARQISVALHRAVSGGWVLACLLTASACGSGSAHPAAAQAAPGHRGHRQVGLRERVGIRAVPGIRPRRPADPGRGRRLVRPARRRGRGPCPGLATGQPPRPRRDGPIWPGHTPRRPGTRPDMAGRQRQLVLLSRVVRRYNSPDGSAFPPPSVLVPGAGWRSGLASTHPAPRQGAAAMTMSPGPGCSVMRSSAALAPAHAARASSPGAQRPSRSHGRRGGVLASAGCI
jgi:hypothetical protein